MCIQLLELSTFFTKVAASPMKLSHFDDVGAQSEGSVLQLRTVADLYMRTGNGVKRRNLFTLMNTISRFSCKFLYHRRIIAKDSIRLKFEPETGWNFDLQLGGDM